MSSRELLEVEDEEARRDRLQSILESVDARGSQSMPPPPVPPFPFGQQPTSPLPPPTDLLNRVQAFLPQFAASNAALAQQDPGAINMENIDPTQEQIIQMRLGLGVYEERARRGSSSSSSSSSSSTSSASDSDSSDSSSDEDSDSDEDLDPISAFLMASRPARPLPRRTGPPAVSVLSSSTSASSTSVTTVDSMTSDSSAAATDVTGPL
ncbi:hypothetical protein PENSPDRAFT_693638 [Peniophora sp. CONT]|nr:hypothetical protein PENSPDRAFT_693638 [Peniophora sp. CONT]